MKKPKKPLIITIISVAALLVVLTGIFLYPHFIERKISTILRDELSDVVKIELRNGRSFREAETSDPDEIKYIVDFATNIKVKKSFDQRVLIGSSLGMTFIKESGEKIVISFTGGITIKGTRYNYDSSSGSSTTPIKDEIISKYGLDQPLSQEEFDKLYENTRIN